MKKNTLMDNEYGNQFFHDDKKTKSQFGGGFVGMYCEEKREMNKKKPRKLFPGVSDFMER